MDTSFTGTNPEIITLSDEAFDKLQTLIEVDNSVPNANLVKLMMNHKIRWTNGEVNA